MSHSLTVELSEAVYAALLRHAQSAAQSPAQAASTVLEQFLGAGDSASPVGDVRSEAEKQAARQRFERHVGAVNLGSATGTDNEGIDADLARAYADTHEEG